MAAKKQSNNSFSDILKKGILFGLGAFDYSKEKLEKNVSEFMDKQKIDRNEGRKMVDDVLKKAEKYKKDQEKYIKSVVKNAIEELGVATKKDLESFKKNSSAKSTTVNKKTKNR